MRHEARSKSNKYGVNLTIKIDILIEACRKKGQGGEGKGGGGTRFGPGQIFETNVTAAKTFESNPLGEGERG